MGSCRHRFVGVCSKLVNQLSSTYDPLVVVSAVGNTCQTCQKFGKRGIKKFTLAKSSYRLGRFGYNCCLFQQRISFEIFNITIQDAVKHLHFFYPLLKKATVVAETSETIRIFSQCKLFHSSFTRPYISLYILTSAF